MNTLFSFMLEVSPPAQFIAISPDDMLKKFRCLICKCGICTMMIDEVAVIHFALNDKITYCMDNEKERGP